VAVFDFALTNLPESFLESRMTTKGRVEYYFRAINSVAVLFVEFKYQIGGASERLGAIAQIIAVRPLFGKFYLTNHLLGHSRRLE
jgi:hypothetical protein